MRLEPFLCLGGNELSNHARTAAYVNNVGLPGAIMSQECACYAFDEGYDLPLSDPAPWYDITRPESADFLGFVAWDARTETVYANEDPVSVVISVTGTMLATTPRGMTYGEHWLREALRGEYCYNCSGDDLLLLPACPEDITYDADVDFRTLVNVRRADGPVYSNLQDLPECRVQTASFTLNARQPYFFHPAQRCLDADSAMYDERLACSLTTPEWMGSGTFVIDYTNTDAIDITNLRIIGRISLDGSCPVSGLGTSVPSSYEYIVPLLKPKDRIVIDGRKRQALYYDASCKTPSSALPYLDFEGPFLWPDVGPCTTMCLTIESDGGEGIATVDTYLKEL